MTQPVRIPADVDREDTVLANLTAHQLLILALTGITLYGLWSITRPLVPLPVFLILAVPVGAMAAFLALGKRDGVPLDRLLLAALRQRMTPRHQINAPEGTHPAPTWLAAQAVGHGHLASSTTRAAVRLPADSASETGVVDLGPDGIAVVAVCSTVNFALRTPAEQEALVTAFGRYLHSLTAPVQILVRTERLDLSSQIGELRQRAPSLPDPSLEAAALAHADFLDELSRGDLLRRQILLVLREPQDSGAPMDTLDSGSPLAVFARRRRSQARSGPKSPAALRAAEARLVRRFGEAAELLGPLGILVTPLDAGQTTTVLAAACNPDCLLPVSSELAGTDDIITSSMPDASWPGPSAEEDRRFAP
ncbi:PrgI family protein [Streptomyces sp. NBC_00287]|uniref:PrgI family protein n=1 Tax=Streptomyces sp. NBC_00287 TaxID=2975702 RepID=UPI002E2A02A7|nr:PrgI family protein [Streptomyces sp. NBC_00287]